MWSSVPKTWHMPDGTKTVNKPRDGQTWSKFDFQGKEIEKWQWEGTKDCWVNVSSGQPTKANTATFAINPIELDNFPYTWDVNGSIQPIRVIKCECGAESVGTPRHISWCPKYHPEQ